jgi:LysR family transcriptional regulator, transcriptional activator of the cysJI operon
MNTRQFQVFLAVCDSGTMTSAARILFMTQPSVSQVIAELEKEYGVHLFERLNHHLYLTAAGEQLRLYANQILHLSEQAKKELADLGEGGSIRIGASLTIGTYLLPNIINSYRQKMPKAEIFTLVDNTSVIEKMILEDHLDLGLVEGPIHSPFIREEAFSDDELVIICGLGHSLWGRKMIEPNDLAGNAFIIREPGSGTRDIFERVMSELGVIWTVAGVYNNTEAIKQAVRGNLGLAVVPKISVEEEIKQGLVWVIEVKKLNLKRKFNLVYHHQKFFTTTIRTFIQTCKKNSSVSIEEQQ